MLFQKSSLPFFSLLALSTTMILYPMDTRRYQPRRTTTRTYDNDPHRQLMTQLASISGAIQASQQATQSNQQQLMDQLRVMNAMLEQNRQMLWFLINFFIQPPVYIPPSEAQRTPASLPEEISTDEQARANREQNTQASLPEETPADEQASANRALQQILRQPASSSDAYQLTGVPGPRAQQQLRVSPTSAFSPALNSGAQNRQ